MKWIECLFHLAIEKNVFVVFFSLFDDGSDGGGMMEKNENK